MCSATWGAAPVSDSKSARASLRSIAAPWLLGQLEDRLGAQEVAPAHKSTSQLALPGAAEGWARCEGLVGLAK